MATSLSNLLALLALDESAYLKGLDSSKKATDSFAGDLASVGGSIVLGAVTAVATAVVGIGTAAFDAAETVDEALDNIAIATGAQGEVLAQLEDDWKAVFTSVPTDAGSAADAISVLNSRLDITGPALQNLAAPLLEVTRILGGDLKQNAEDFTRVMGDWNLPIEEAPAYLDALFVASQQTGVGISQLMQQVVQYGAPMRNFGFSFEEATALLAAFESQGVNTEIVMSGLRIAQGKFITQGKDMNTGLWETIDAIQNAANQTDALAIATEIFGAKAAGDMVDTILSGKFSLDGLVDSMMNADGAIMDAAQATSDWGETWKTFQNKMTVALAPLGDKLREGMGAALDQVVEIFERPDVQNAMTVFADFAVQAIGTVVEYIPVLVDGFFQFVDFLKNNEGILIGVFVALAAAALVWGATTAAAAWAAIVPMLPVIAVIALIAAAAYLLYEAWTNNWGGIQEKVQAVWDYISPILQGIWDWLSLNIPLALQTLSEFWTNILLPAITNVWMWLSTVLFPFFQALADFISAVFSVALTAFAGIWQNVLQPALTAVFGVVSDKLMPIFQTVGGFIQDTLMPVVGDLADWVGNALVTAFEGLSDILRTVTKGLSSLTSSLGNITLPAWMTPGSPTPWEIGLYGVSAAMQELSKMAVPQLSASMELLPAPAVAPAAYGAQPAAVATETGSTNNDELLRLMRDLPNEIARAVASQLAKTSRRVN